MEKGFLTRFVRGIAVIGFGTFCQIVLGFLGLMIAVRLVSKEEFGAFVLIQVIAMFFSVISSLVLENMSVIRFITTESGLQKAEVVNTALSFKFLIVLFFCIIILFCKPVINFFYKSAYVSQLIIYIPLYFALYNFNDLLCRILQGFHRYRELAYSQIINGVTKLLLVITFLKIFKMGVGGLIGAFLVALLVSTLYQYWMVPTKKYFKLNFLLLKKMLRFGFPLGLNNVLTFVFTKIDRFMIGAMISPVGVAYYEIAAKIPESVRRIYQSFNSVFFPNMSELFANNKQAQAEKVLNESLRMISFIVIFLAFLVFLFQKEIICVLFSKHYLDSAPALTLLMMSLAVGLIGNILGTTLVALGHSDKPAKINIVDTIINVIGNLLLIPKFGIMGAVYATLLARIATNPVNVFFLRRAGIKINVWAYLKPFLVFVICTSIFLMLKQLGNFIIYFVIALFVFLCMALSVVTKNDFEILIRNFKKKQVQ